MKYKIQGNILKDHDNIQNKKGENLRNIVKEIGKIYKENIQGRRNYYTIYI